MKKYILPLLTCALVIAGVSSCSENFTVSAPYKNITVIYGLLDIGDTAHYIRIEKAFLDENKSALTLAKIPDSNYYDSLDVSVKVMQGNNLIKTIPLTKVDLTNEGYPKDTGTFFTSPNYAYKFKEPLQTSYTYRLLVTNPYSGETDSAETPIISNDINAYQGIFITSNLTLNLTNVTTGKFTLSGPAPSHAATFEGIMRFHYMDSNLVTGVETPRSADWDFGTYDNTSTYQLTIQNVDIYSAIRNLLGTPPDNTVRLMDSCDIILYSATQDYLTYRIITETQSSGLTGYTVQPSYTNIKGANVLGLYAARTSVKDTNIGFSPQTIDSIMTNPITAPTKIRGITLH